MSNLFDENRDESRFDAADDFSGGKVDFRITGTADLYPQNRRLIPDGANDPHSGFQRTGNIAYEDPLKAMNEPFGPFPEKQSMGFDGTGTVGLGSSHAFYSNKAELKDGAAAASRNPSGHDTYKWGSNWLSRNMNSADTADPAHNAAVKAMAKMERGDHDFRWFEQAERLDAVLREKPEERITGNLSHKTNWDGKPSESHSLKAAEDGFKALEKDNARLKRVQKLAQTLELNAQQAQLQDGQATGLAAYQNAHHTAAHEGISTADQLEKIAQIYGQPVGKVAAQLGLSSWHGVFNSTPVKAAGLLPKTINYVSQSFGGGKVVNDLSTGSEIFSKTGDEMLGAESIFTDPDGQRTAEGKVVEVANSAAGNLFDAFLLAVGAGVFGPRVAAGAIPVNVADAFLDGYQKERDELNKMDGHALANHPEIMPRFRWHQQLGKSDEAALNDAKNEVAKKRASLFAGSSLAREIIHLKLFRAAPGERELLRRAMENGHIVHAGDTAM
ncbi:MAG: hypothetical protein FWG01_00980 [Betaproteobacteria bacterium]|nr:hypothetical protein [Betaproteobacteria bacterium]